MNKPVIVVTGASRRLGLFLCEQFLKSDYAVVAITRYSSEALESLKKVGDIDIFQLGVESEALKGEETQDSQIYTLTVQATIQSIREKYSRISALVHNASKFGKDQEHFSFDEYLSFFQIHMALPAQLNEGLQTHLYNEDEPGNIIHITDIFSENPNPIFALYCSTKAALENLSKSYAKKFAPGIRVNTIQPGPIQFLESHTEEAKKKVLQETLLQFEGGFMPVFQAVCTIIDNPYITGSTIKVDGGRALGRG